METDEGRVWRRIFIRRKTNSFGLNCEGEEKKKKSGKGNEVRLYFVGRMGLVQQKANTQFNNINKHIVTESEQQNSHSPVMSQEKREMKTGCYYFHRKVKEKAGGGEGDLSPWRKSRKYVFLEPPLTGWLRSNTVQRRSWDRRAFLYDVTVDVPTRE